MPRNPSMAVIAVFVVPGLRARRGIFWSVLVVARAARVGSLLWTYLV
jgi:hypothetical protein